LPITVRRVFRHFTGRRAEVFLRQEYFLMKKNPAIFGAITLLFTFFLSCESSREGKKDGDLPVEGTRTEKKAGRIKTFSGECRSGNSLAVKIKNFKPGMLGKFELDTKNFEVRQTFFNITSDTSAELMLLNYEITDPEKNRADNEIDLRVKFFTRNGKKMKTGIYYASSENEYWCIPCIWTSKGPVYFNWIRGMKEVGYVSLDHIGNGRACGSFALASEHPDTDLVGTVKLSGTFKAGEDVAR
jgi:hypothetical protein